ncbi:unnamed protein product [Callosobruchus maculatus]|uniref:Uncharacterized protein n=1 Tax=Callosobruchus maculatus TaxID=64391 RepID=A0A653DXK2_CALMS|nr:unnamed protein product [Callosobruchus maculatus]
MAFLVQRMHQLQLPHLHQRHLQSLKNFSRAVTLIHRRTLNLQKPHLQREVGWLGSQQRRRVSSQQGNCPHIKREQAGERETHRIFKTTNCSEDM